MARKYVYFDLEGTGLREEDPDIEILQISAVTEDLSDSFDKYLHPVKHFPTESASKVNKLTYDQEKKILYRTLPDKKERVCKAAPGKSAALAEFILWLANIGSGCKVSLVAYSGCRYDAPLLEKKMAEHPNLYEKFKLYHDEMIDPINAVATLYPQIQPKSFENVLNHFGILHPDEKQSHNALEDANNLRKLCEIMYAQKGRPFGLTYDAFCQKYYKRHEPLYA